MRGYNCDSCGRFVGKDGAAIVQGCNHPDGESEHWTAVLCRDCKPKGKAGQS